MIIAPHSNVCDDIPNTNDSLDGLIPTDATKEASAENPGSVQGIQVGRTIYSGDTEPLPVPMIPPDSSWIYPNRMSASTFTQGGTPKPSVLTLGASKQQPLPLDRSSPKPFPCQEGASDKLPSPLESTHGRGDCDEETENLTASMARRLFKGGSQSPSPAVTSVEGMLGISATAGRYVELYGDKKESGEEGGGYSSPGDVSLLLELGDHGLSKWARGYGDPGTCRSMAKSKDKSRDEKSTDGKAFLPLPDMTVSPMEYIYPNYHL